MKKRAGVGALNWKTGMRRFRAVIVWQSISTIGYTRIIGVFKRGVPWLLVLPDNASKATQLTNKHITPAKINLLAFITTCIYHHNARNYH